MHYNGDNSYFSLVEKKSISLKLIIKKYPTKLCLGSISNKFDTIGSKGVLLEGNKYDFPVNYNAIDKSYNSLPPEKALILRNVKILIKSDLITILIKIKITIITIYF